MTVVACHLPPFGVGTFMAFNSSAAFRADSADIYRPVPYPSSYLCSVVKNRMIASQRLLLGCPFLFRSNVYSPIEPLGPTSNGSAALTGTHLKHATILARSYQINGGDNDV